MKLSSIKIKQKKQQRINFIVVSALVSIFAFVFIFINFRENIVFFYSPSEIVNFSSQNKKISNKKIIRVGGLVKDGSIINDNNNLEFVITDFKSDIKIKYSGIKPDLFRAKQGTVAKGFWDRENNIFIASELLTKHDEKYMPPEVKKIISKNISGNKTQNNKIK